MSKLSLSALAERAESNVSIELLQTISGGTDDDCHVSTPPPCSGRRLQRQPGGGVMILQCNCCHSETEME